MPFSTLQPFSLNRRRLSQPLGLLRLITLICCLAAALQLLLPAVTRLALNGGRVFYGDEQMSLWGAVLPWPVFHVPAWLTILTVAVGSIAGGLYLFLGGRRVSFDTAYIVTMGLLLFGVFPWAIAALGMDASGIISTPGEDGYPIGWHWISVPLVVLLPLGALLGRTRTPPAEDD
ncbi:MAG: hypothetical protein ACQEW8_01120 [Actinomycetota bacterium]